MKTFKKLCPTWDDIISQNSGIPKDSYAIEQEEYELINNLMPDIGEPCCCIVGEAWGSDKYFHETVDGILPSPPNPNYCYMCHMFSMKFMGFQGRELKGETKRDFNNTKKSFVNHMNEIHREILE